MNKFNNNYWMYSKHSIESALLNPNRKILKFLIEEKLLNYYKDFFFNQNLKKN